MEAAATSDGRALTLELDVMREKGAVDRTPDGLWILTPA